MTCKGPNQQNGYIWPLAIKYDNHLSLLFFTDIGYLILGTLRNHNGNANENVAWKRYLYNFVIIPIRSTCAMWPNYPVTEQVETAFKLRQRLKNLPSCTHVLLKTLNLVMAEFILETNYPSRRIIRQTDNSSKYKSEDEFWRIICLVILRGLHDGRFGVEEPSGSLGRGQNQYGGTRSVAIVDEHIEKSIRHACGISEKNIPCQAHAWHRR